MDTNSTPETRQRAETAAARIAAIGIPKQELAQLAGIDRGTLGRALSADPRVVDRTWVKIERVLSNLEAELGIAAQAVSQGQMTASGETVTSTVEYDKDGTHATITMAGRAADVAEAIRRVLQGDDAG